MPKAKGHAVRLIAINMWAFESRKAAMTSAIWPLY